MNETLIDVNAHRRKLIINFRNSILGSGEKGYILSTITEIEEAIKCNMDKDKFTEKQMLKGLRTFLQKQKGIIRISTDYYQISRDFE